MKRCINLVYKYWPQILIFFILLFLFRNVLFPSTGKIIYGGDLLTQFYFWKDYLVESLKNGYIPFWNPYNFSGTPFLSHPATAFFYPATILYLLFPLNIAFSLNYFLHFIIGGFGMYRLTRIYADRFSSLIASLVFILSGYFSARVFAGHVDLLTTAVWIPWVFVGFKDVLEKGSKKNILKATVFFSLMILAGYMAYVLFTVEFLLLYLFFFVIKNRIFDWKGIRTKILPVLLSVSFSFLITCIQWLPTWQLTKLSIRGEGLPYDLASWGSLPLSGVKLLFNPYDLSELNRITYSLGGGLVTNFFDHYIGRLPVVAIFIFLILKITSRLFFPKQKNLFKVNIDFWVFLTISVFFFWISFGFYISPNLHGFLYRIIPLYRHIRIPIQHLIYLVFLVPLMLGIIISLIKNKIVKIILLVIFVFELFGFSSKYIFLTDIPEKNYDQKLMNYLQDKAKSERLLPYFRVVSPVLSVFDFNSLMKYKTPSTSGYDPVILKNYYDFIDLTNKSFTSSLPFYNVEIPPLKLQKGIVNYLNIGYILAERNTNLESLDYKLVLTGNLYDLFQNINTTPRFFIVNNVQIYDLRKSLKEALVRKDFDFSNTVLLEKQELDETSIFDLSCNQKTLGEINVISYTPNKVTLKVKNICNSFLSTSEVYYPGWRAKIDGLNTKILQGNFAFRTIYLPKGEYSVEFYYFPKIYYLAAFISLSSLLISILIYRNQRNTMES